MFGRSLSLSFGFLCILKGRDKWALLNIREGGATEQLLRGESMSSYTYFPFDEEDNGFGMFVPLTVW